MDAQSVKMGVFSVSARTRGRRVEVGVPKTGFGENETGLYDGDVSLFDQLSTLGGSTGCANGGVFNVSVPLGHCGSEMGVNAGLCKHEFG